MQPKGTTMKTLGERLIYLDAPERRPRRAAYALPTLFTAGNVYLGFYALLQIIQGAMLYAQGATNGREFFERASIAIGVAVFLDGLDGRIARMTNTCSDFGREMDSLADCVSFGIAPAMLAFVWGIQFVEMPQYPALAAVITQDQLRSAGYFVAFLYLICGASRLARFNVSKNPVPKNPAVRIANTSSGCPSRPLPAASRRLSTY